MNELFNREGGSYEKNLISDAVINLYAAHVHSLLYPYNHPLVSDSLKNAFQGLQKALRKKKNIRLDATSEGLTVDGETLNGDVSVLGNFASWLRSINIGALSFGADVTRRELIAFHRIISTEKQTIEEISKAMIGKSVVGIKVEPVGSVTVRRSKVSPDHKARKGLIEDYESTMYQMERGQSRDPFFMRPDGTGPFDDAAGYGLVEEYGSKIEKREDEQYHAPDPVDPGSTGATAEAARHAECVEALLEGDICEEDRSLIKSMPPEEMAHLLNTILFTAPGEEVATRITKAYFGDPKEMQGKDASERCRIFLTTLSSSLRPPFLLCFASLPDTDATLGNEIDIMRKSAQEPCRPAGAGTDEDAIHVQPVPPSRTVEGSDFTFDSVVCGNAVVHDIEIPKETACIFNEERLSHFENEGVPDDLSASLGSAAGDAEFQTLIITGCTAEAIAETCFDVMLDLLRSTSLEEDAYRKLEGRLAAMVESLSEDGEFEKILDLLNALKAQSLQAKRSVDAAVMIRRIFAPERINTKIVEAMRQYGRKRRESVWRLTNALRSFIIPYLLDALGKETDTSTRRFIISLVTSVKGDAVDHIAKRLRESSWYITRNMLYLIRECEGTSYISAVRGFLDHEVPLVRLEALRTLLSFQDRDADYYVTKFLGSDVFQLRQGAVRLAGAYRIKSTVPHLVKMLREKDGIKGRSNFKRLIVRALSRIGDSRAVNDLLDICRSSTGLRNSESDKLQTEIFRTLHNYSVAAIRPLIDYGMHSTKREIVDISKKLKDRYDLLVGK